MTTEDFECRAPGHAGCTKEYRKDGLWFTHRPSESGFQRNGFGGVVTDTATQPADDVREAVDHAVRAALSPLGIDYVPWWKVVHAVRDSLLAEPMLEVRARRTLTDADDVRKALDCEATWPDADDPEEGLHHCQLAADGHSWHRCTCGDTTGPSTPLADDVREALATKWLTSYHGSIDATALTLAFKAGYAAAEVRPRGTVTDAEVDAAVEGYEAYYEEYPGTERDAMRAALKAAREVRS